MRVAINLATRPFADIGPLLKRLRIAMGVLALFAIAFGFGLHELHQKAEEARARDHSLDGKIGSLTRERQGYQALMRQPDNAQALQEAENLNQLFDEKAFSWTLAMEDLETVLPAGLQVTTIEPNRNKDGHITLRLRVVGPRDRAVELVKNLEHSRRFSEPRIVGENSESTGRPGEPAEPVSASNRVDFDVLSEYMPASPEERSEANRKARAAERSTVESVTRGSRPRAGVGHGRPPYTGAPQPQSPIQPRAGGPR
jgi:type IV pilus assembly protein PilN